MITLRFSRKWLVALALIAATAVLAAQQPMTVTNVSFNRGITGANTMRVIHAGTTPVVLTGLTNTAQTIIVAADYLEAISCDNTNATWAYVQAYDSGGAITVGTTAAVRDFPIAPGAMINLTSLHLRFTAGLKVAATTGPTNGTALATALNCWADYQ